MKIQMVGRNVIFLSESKRGVKCSCGKSKADIQRGIRSEYRM